MNMTLENFLLTLLSRERGNIVAVKLTLKRLGRGSIWPHPCGFSKNISSKERDKPCFLVSFNIIISYIFPENFIDVLQTILKICRISLLVLAIFINFHQLLDFFWHFLANDVIQTTWCQHFFHYQHTLNRLFNNCILHWYCISSSRNILGGVSNWPPVPRKNYLHNAQPY